MEVLSVTGFPQALEIMEYLENPPKKVQCMEKSWNLKKKTEYSSKNDGILGSNLTKPPVAKKLAVGHMCVQQLVF